jgi:hypothetical protein
MAPRQPPEPPADVKKAIEQADRILEAIEDDLPERAWDRAADFFEDVQTKVKDVRATVERLQRVSEKQLLALDNWEAAVNKWIDPNG